MRLKPSEKTKETSKSIEKLLKKEKGFYKILLKTEMISLEKMRNFSTVSKTMREK